MGDGWGASRVSSLAYRTKGAVARYEVGVSEKIWYSSTLLPDQDYMMTLSSSDALQLDWVAAEGK